MAKELLELDNKTGEITLDCEAIYKVGRDGI